MPRTTVVAIGGNAILRDGQRGTSEEQLANLRTACESIARMIRSGVNIVLTHGNGPQVGNILVQNEAAKSDTPAQPLDVCGAQSQGSLGYQIQQTLRTVLASKGLTRDVVSVITQMVVDAKDPAFLKPSKPVGPWYTENESRQLSEQKGWRMRKIKDSGEKQYRRVVPSPVPLEIVERAIIRKLVKSGVVVIAAGGGGIPVIRNEMALTGVEAVIDKDLASGVLARDIGADVLVILTDVKKVAINFRKPDQRFLDRLTVSEAKKHLAEGQFPPGSMGPKVEAGVLFLSSRKERSLDDFGPAESKGKGGPQRKVVIASLEDAQEALAGRSGTTIIPD